MAFPRLAAALALAILLPSPAAAHYIIAKLDRDGNGLAGPSQSAGTGLADSTSTSVSVHYSGGFPPPSIPVVPPGTPINSEIAGRSFVDLATGVMRGEAHAASFGHFETHSMRFVGRMAESIKVDVPLAVPAADRFALFVGEVHASGAASNIALATALYSLEISGKRVAASLQSDGQWKVIDGQGLSFLDIATLANGYRFTLKLPIPLNGNFSIDSQLEGTAWAQGRVGFGVGIADVQAMNTARLSMVLPTGATYTSTSGVFLTQPFVPSPVPEPQTWLMMLGGLGALLMLSRRRR